MITESRPLPNPDQLTELASQIKAWGKALGFAGVGITDVQLEQAETHLEDWLAKGWHGEMAYMASHGKKRSRPAALLPGTVRIITVRMDYLPDDGINPWSILEDPTLAYLSRYALGRDYHKVLRQRLQKLADQIRDVLGPFQYRAFVDSAPVLEKPLAEKSGLGWIGKHTNLINSKSGSWFFLGTLYVDLPLPIDTPATNHCGTCHACLDICPTQAIIAPYQLDARRCISYLTIELDGPIPEEFRRPMGNRIYGCDDCQLVCPWNKFAQPTGELDFAPRHTLSAPQLMELFAWDEEEFLRKTEGSAIRRIGHQRWLRNLAVALGNAPANAEIINALNAKADHSSPMVREHLDWAISEQRRKLSGLDNELSSAETSGDNNPATPE